MLAVAGGTRCTFSHHMCTLVPSAWDILAHGPPPSGGSSAQLLSLFPSHPVATYFRATRTSAQWKPKPDPCGMWKAGARLVPVSEAETRVSPGQLPGRNHEWPITGRESWHVAPSRARSAPRGTFLRAPSYQHRSGSFVPGWQLLAVQQVGVRALALPLSAMLYTTQVEPALGPAGHPQAEP